jgi:hypothetical protein
MLTYGTPRSSDPLEALVSGNKQDVVELGENNSCWMSVVVSKKVLELRDKETGKITRVPIDEHFSHVAEARHKLGPVRIATALRLASENG